MKCILHRKVDLHFSSRDRSVSRRNINLSRDKWKRHCYSGYAYYAWASLVKKRHVIEETKKKERKKRYVRRAYVNFARRVIGFRTVVPTKKRMLYREQVVLDLAADAARHKFSQPNPLVSPIELEIASRFCFNRATSVFASLRRTITSPTSRTQSPKVLSDRVKPV